MFSCASIFSKGEFGYCSQLLASGSSYTMQIIAIIIKHDDSGSAIIKRSGLEGI